MRFVSIFTIPYYFSSIRRSACRRVSGRFYLWPSSRTENIFGATNFLRFSFLRRIIVILPFALIPTGYFICIKSTCGLALSFRLQHIKWRTYFFELFGKHNITLLHALILSTIYSVFWCASAIVWTRAFQFLFRCWSNIVCMTAQEPWPRPMHNELQCKGLPQMAAANTSLCIFSALLVFPSNTRIIT